MQTLQRTTVSEHPGLLSLPEAKTHAFSIGLRRRPPGHFVWHYHPEIELMWTWRGQGLRYVGGSVERFKPGDLVLMGAHLPHMWVAADEEAFSTVIHLLPERWGAGFWQLPEVQELRRLLSMASHGLRFTGPTAARIGNDIQALASRPAHDLGSLGRLLAICEHLARAPHYALNPRPWKQASLKRDPRLDRVLAWIQSHVTEAITQEQAAALVGMSPAAFSRWFKKDVGRVFHRHLNELRVAMVCARLSSGQESITEAAFQSGYNNLANFNRRFREITGLTPTDFRRRTRRMQQDTDKPFVIRLDGNGAVRVRAEKGC